MTRVSRGVTARARHKKVIKRLTGIPISSVFIHSSFPGLPWKYDTIIILGIRVTNAINKTSVYKLFNSYLSTNQSRKSIIPE